MNALTFFIIQCGLRTIVRVRDANSPVLQSFGGRLIDATNERLTYNGGRSLTTAPPVGNVGMLDFNRTVNLPCAFTAFATCPLLPQQNKLSMRVDAGEMGPDQAS